jgi:Tfp pilus assembly protein PilF
VKPILSIFISLVAAIAIGIGIGAYFWTPIDERLTEIYSEPEEEYSIKIKSETPKEEPPAEEEPVEANEDNTQNLITLALNCLKEDPRRCWKYLEKVVEKEPHNLEARIFRAQILEEVGKPSMAREEYILAKADNAHDKTFVDQYACYLMRVGSYDEAYSLIEANIEPPTDANIWLQALFLSKVYKPLSFKWTKNRIPHGAVKPLVRYLAKLPEEQFWNESTFNKVPYNHDFAQSRQAAYWLQLFEALKNKQESKALSLLKNNPFASQSWNPQLEINLQRILTYRKNRTLEFDEKSPIFKRFEKSAQRTTLLTHELHNLAEKEAMSVSYEIPEQMRQLLLSGEAFALALVDASWDEAAIALHRVEVYPSSMPRWAARRFTEALKKNRGNLAALKFAEKQDKNPELDCIIAGLLLETGEHSRAAAKLLVLSRMENKTGLEASRLLAGLYIRDGEYQQAREFIGKTPQLANHVWGQELLARTFIEENQQELAYQIYLGIEKKSSEAKSFLARRAYLEGDWNRARKLTEELTIEYPHNEMFRRNLEKIIEKSGR